jgi:nuclear protein NHN1
MARPYRELPAHRMPHYEDEDIGKRRTVRATREVIVEKASDEWNDPWMRKGAGRSGEKERKSRGAGGVGGARERSYSSNSSYSSSSSSSRSRSRSSSESSHSPGRTRRFDAKRSKERVAPRKIERPKSRSASRRHSPSRRVVKKAPSPVSIPKRNKRPASPTVRAEKGAHARKKRDNSSSSSGSESDSSYSSSTSSSKGKRKREKLAAERKLPVAAKKGSHLKIYANKLSPFIIHSFLPPSIFCTVEMTKKRTTTPPPTKDDEKDKEKSSEKASAAAKMKSSRREELLKQLKAVEDAIARKRSKIN